MGYTGGEIVLPSALWGTMVVMWGFYPDAIGIEWSRDRDRVLWDTMVHYEVLWWCHGLLWSAMGYNGVLWGLCECYGVLEGAMGWYGVV